MNTIIQIWGFVFDCLFFDNNGFLVAFGFAALGVLTALTVTLLFVIPIMLLRKFFSWILSHVPDKVSRHYKNKKWTAAVWFIVEYIYVFILAFLIIGLIAEKVESTAIMPMYLSFLFMAASQCLLFDEHMVF